MTKFDIPQNSHCHICKRNSLEVSLTSYGFNEPKQLIDWNAKTVVTENPNALQIIICGTDLNLVAKIKRETNNLSPSQILCIAIKYRNSHSVKG